MEKLISIDEVIGMHLGNPGRNSEKARLGMAQMISYMCGYSSYDGYKVKTSEHEYNPD